MKAHWETMFKWLEMHAEDPTDKHRRHLLTIFILSIFIALTLISVINVFEMLWSPTLDTPLYLAEDTLALVVLAGSYQLNRAGHTQVAAMIFLALLVVACFTFASSSSFHLALLACCVPLVMASFILVPVSSFAFALLSVAGYIALTLANGVPLQDISKFALVLFSLALVSWLIATCLEKALETMRASKMQYQTLVQNIGEGIAIVDTHERLVFANSAAETIFGVSAGGLIDRNLREFLSLEQYDFVRKQTEQRRQGAQSTYEIEITQPHGKARHLSVTATPQFDSSGQVTGTFGIFRDITDFKMVEEKLRESEHRYREIFNNMSEGLFLLQVTEDERFRLIEMNQSLAQSMGIPPEAVVGKFVEEMQPAAASQTVFAQFRRCVEAGTLIEEEVELDLPSGHRSYSSSLIPLRDPSGRIYRIVVVARDLTERKQAEKSLRASEEKYRTLFEESFDGLFITSPNGKILDMNRKSVMMFGYDTKDEMLRLDLEKDVYASPPDRQRILAQVNAQGAADYEVVVKKKNGEKMITHCSLTAVKNDAGAITSYRGIIRDITASKQADAALRESEARFRAVAESANDAIITIDSLGNITFWNKAACAIFGYSEKEILGRSATMLLPEEYRAGFQHEIKTLGVTGERRRIGRVEEKRGRRKDGGEFPIEYSLATWQTSAGQFFTAMMRDITMQKQAQEALRESEQRYRFLFETAPIGIGITNLAGNVLAANQTLQKITGYPLEELKATGAGFINPDEVRQLGETLSKSGRVLDWETRLTRKDGTVYTGLFNLHLIEMNGQKVIFAGVQDITQRKQAEEEIHRRATEFATLYETANSLATQRELPSLLEFTIETATAQLYADAGLICLYDTAQNDLQVAVAKNLDIQIGARLKLGEGLSGKVAENRQPMLVNDYQAWEGRSVECRESSTIAAVVVPILHGAELIGVLSILDTQEPTHKFNDSDVRFLTLLATQVASAMHNARLFQEVTTNAEQLALLYDAGLTLNRVLDPQEQLRLLLEIAVKTLHAERAEFFRFDAASNSLRYELSAGHAEKYVEARMRDEYFALGEERGLVGWVAKYRLPLYLPNVTRDPRWMIINPEIRSSLWVPVEHENHLHGVLTLTSMRVNAFTAQDERLLVLFANQVAVAMESARMYEETRRRAETLEVLNGAALHIQQRFDASEVLKTACDELRQFGTFASAFLAEGNQLNHAHTSMSPELLDEYVATFGERGIPLSIPLSAIEPVWSKLESGESAMERGLLPQIISLMPPESRQVGEWLYAKSGQGSVLFAPLTRAGATVENETIGVMTVIGDQLNASDVLAVALFARHTSIAMENARLTEHVVENKALRELDRLRSELVANVSHELRTPLGLIKLLCSNLLREDVRFPEAERREFLGEIEEESDKLERIVGNLLDISRIQNGRLQLDKQPMNLRELIERVITSTTTLDTAHRFAQDLPSTPFVAIVDAKRIEQVLSNLLNNAIKYSPPGGTITVRGIREGDQLLIQVSDQGIGIAQSDLARIFERFYRADNETTRRVGGVGLGLAICREIVEAHGGSIWAESTQNVGSTFSFILPLAGG